MSPRPTALLASLLTVCLLAPSVQAIPSLWPSSKVKTQVITLMESQALMPALAGAAFLGAALYPQTFADVYQLAKVHLHEILVGASLLIPAAVLGPKNHASHRVKRVTFPTPTIRELSPLEPYRIERTMMASIILPMLEEANDLLADAQMAVDKAGTSATPADLGELSSAQAYRNRVDHLWDAVLADDFALETLTGQLREFEKPKSLAVARLAEDDRVHFVEWMVLRITHLPGLSVRRAPLRDLNQERLMNALEALELESKGIVGSVVFAFKATEVDHMDPEQRARLVDALEQFNDSPTSRHAPLARLQNDIPFLAGVHQLDPVASSVFTFLVLYGQAPENFRSATTFYLTTMLFPRVATQALMTSKYPVLAEWMSQQSAGMVRGLDGVYLRYALEEQFALTSEEAHVLLALGISRKISWISRTAIASSTLLRSILLLAALGGAGWLVGHHPVAVTSPDLGASFVQSAWISPFLFGWRLPFTRFFRSEASPKMLSRFTAAA